MTTRNGWAQVGLFGLALVCGGLFRPATASAQLLDDHIYSLVLFDQLEYRSAGPANPLAWDLNAWIGGDFTRFWLKSEGAQATSSGEDSDFEIQALYGRLIAPYWDLQIGGRVDVAYGGDADVSRVLFVVGLEGLAPYWFDVEPTLFLSQDGDISARLSATYDMFVTQKLIAQPRFEVNAAAQDVPEFGIGSGLNDLELGLRLRYELRREFAPYAGLTWRRRFSGTADLARAAGQPASDAVLVSGVRIWF